VQLREGLREQRVGALNGARWRQGQRVAAAAGRGGRGGAADGEVAVVVVVVVEDRLGPGAVAEALQELDARDRVLSGRRRRLGQARPAVEVGPVGPRRVGAGVAASGARARRRDPEGGGPEVGHDRTHRGHGGGVLAVATGRSDGAVVVVIVVMVVVVVVAAAVSSVVVDIVTGGGMEASATTRGVL